MKNIFLFLMTLLVLVSCKDDSQISNIHKVKVGDITLCIDKVYMPIGDDPNSSTVSLAFMRPDFRPISSNELEKIGKDDFWRNKTSLLLDVEWQGFTEQNLQSRLRAFEQTDHSKYGLTFAKDISKAKGRFLYLEEGYNLRDARVNFIQCRDGGAPNPQCFHRFNQGGLSFHIDYSMKNLSNWEDIKQETISFIEEQKCK